MTVLKATFRTNDEQGRIEIKLTWHKQLTPNYSTSGYIVSVGRECVFASAGHEPALRYAVRLYRKYEKESNERATAQSKTI